MLLRIAYPCKLGSKVSGHIILTPRTTSSPARVRFEPTKSSKVESSSPSFLVNDILEIKRRALSMGRSALGIVAGVSIQGTAIEIRVKTLLDENGHPKDAVVNVPEGDEGANVGEALVFTNVLRREQLFVRLISMGDQQWETI